MMFTNLHGNQRDDSRREGKQQVYRCAYVEHRLFVLWWNKAQYPTRKQLIEQHTS